MGELGTVEDSFSFEVGFCITLGGEVCFSVEVYFVEVCFLGELDAVEGCILDKSRSTEICITVEFGGRENTFFNCEGIERIENRSSTEIKIEFAPCARSDGQFFVFKGGFTGAVAHLGENKTTNLGFIFEFILVCRA